MLALIIILILFIIVDLLFYVPIVIHLYIAKDKIALFVFTFPIVYVSETKTINHLKNKISIEKIIHADPANIKYIESIDLVTLKINYQFLKDMHDKYVYLFPIIGIIHSFNKSLFQDRIKLEYKPNENYYAYAKIQVKIARVVKYYFIVRRIKHERASYQRNIKDVHDSTR